MYSETAFLRDSELQLSLLHHYILFISDQHLWYDGCLHWNSLKAKKITLHWSVNIMNLYQGATQNMKLHLYLRMNILKTIPLWIQFNFSLSNNIIYISGWNLRYVTNHLIFYSFNTFILISVFSNLFWSFNMVRKWKGNGLAAQQDDGEASGQLQDYGAATGRRMGCWKTAEWRRRHGTTAGWRRRHRTTAGWRRWRGTMAGWCATWRSRSWRGGPCFLMPLFHLQKRTF